MFGKLKEKLKSFLGKPGEEPEKDEKPSKKYEREKKQKKEKKTPHEPASTKSQEIIEEVIEEEKEEAPVEQVTSEPEEITKKPSFLSKFTKKLTTTTLKQENVDEILEPLELILLENNVALEAVDKIKQKLSEDLVGIEVKKGTDLKKTITSALRESIESILIEPENLISKINKKQGTFVIVFFGINGSGKTTSIAKLAHMLKKNKIPSVMAAADTFRAAAIQQLEAHGKKLGIKVIKQDYGSDPTAVAFDAKKYAEKNEIKCVLIDTAGRMYTKENLIKQMEKIIRVIKPDLKIFVGESITGNDATQQAKTFNDAAGIDGIILSKADVDEKGGAALSVSQVTGKPIYFLGTGQNYSDLQEFKKQDIIKNLGLS